MRAILAILLVLTALAGCTENPEETTPDATAEAPDVPSDATGIDAAEPAVPATSTEATEDTPPLSGTVTDLAGAPIAGAQVYIEVVDLTEPVNNIAEYIAGKTATLQVTGADGRFEMFIEAGDHMVAVRADGFLPLHRAVTVTSDGVDITLDLAPWDMAVSTTAHRGASAYAPENTLEAVWKAHLLGAPKHEFDVVLSQDGVPYVLHDASLDRTTDCSGQAFQYTWAEVQDCDAGYADKFEDAFAGTKLPTLEEILQLSLDLGIFAVVEIKFDNDPTMRVMTESIAVAKGLGLTADDAMFMSFGHHLVLQCATLSEETCGQILFASEGDPTTLQETVLSPLAEEIHAPSSSVSESYVGHIHSLGYELTAWTVDDPARMQELIAWGVDTVTTNTPDVMMLQLDQLARA